MVNGRLKRTVLPAVCCTKQQLLGKNLPYDNRIKKTKERRLEKKM